MCTIVCYITYQVDSCSIYTGRQLSLYHSKHSQLFQDPIHIQHCINTYTYNVHTGQLNIIQFFRIIILICGVSTIGILYLELTCVQITIIRTQLYIATLYVYTHYTSFYIVCFMYISDRTHKLDVYIESTNYIRWNIF